MDLEEYRQRHGLNYGELAELIGLSSESSARRLAQGVHWPSNPETIAGIIDATGGEVTLEAMFARRAAWWRENRSGKVAAAE